MHKRSIRNSSFDLRCNKSLRDMLGKYAAVTAYMEISCRKSDEITSGMNATQKKAFLSEESSKYSIQLNDLPEALHPNLRDRSYMVLPWATFDGFFSEFAKEVRQLVNPDFNINPKQNENKLTVAIRELNNLGCTPRLETFKLDTYYYYNKIRTDFAHNLIDESELRKEMSLYNKLDIDSIHQFFPTIVDAPSFPSELKYADFTLFEAMIIHIADMMTVSIEEKIDWRRYITEGIKNHQQKRTLKAAKDESWEKINDIFPKIDQYVGKRQLSYICNCIKSLYGVSLPFSDIEEIIRPIE